MITFDVNTSLDTVDGTPPGRTFTPLRYTTTVRDGIRVGVWTQLATILGSYAFDTGQGLDVIGIMDPSASDAERAAKVTDVVLGYPGVVAITDGPNVEIIDGSLASITLTAETTDGPISVAA